MFYFLVQGKKFADRMMAGHDYSVSLHSLVQSSLLSREKGKKKLKCDKIEFMNKIK